MILWYYQIRPKVAGKHMVHELMDTIPRSRSKTLPLRKIRVYHSKNHVILHPVIAAILNVILNILQR